MESTASLPNGAAASTAAPVISPTIEDLERRIAALESDRNRLMNALKDAAAMMLKNPIAMGMMPKDMKNGLREYLRREGIDV